VIPERDDGRTQETDEDYDEYEDEFGPGDADYDLSEEHGYLEDATPIWRPQPWLIATITVVVVASLILPTIFTILLLRD
jgi:hypothetical protein